MVKIRNWIVAAGDNVWFNRTKMIYLRIGDSGSQKKPAPPYYIEIKVRGGQNEWEEIGSGVSTKERAIGKAISYMRRNT